MQIKDYITFNFFLVQSRLRKILSNFISLFLFFPIFFCSCQNDQEHTISGSTKIKNDSIVNIKFSALSDSIYTIPWKNKTRKVVCRAADSAKGTILLLPGWNFAPDEWCTKMDFCVKAKEAGYNLIMPDMLKSMYAVEYYKQTRKDFFESPTRKWVNDTLIPYFQKVFGIFLKEQNNFVCGISTGGRGSVLIAMDNPDIFKKGVSMSGDFNPLSMKKDNLLNLYYGPYDKFKKRWENSDNAFLRINDLKMPFFLFHGESDKVVPPAQSIDFYKESVSKKNNFIKLKMVKSAGHNYKFWNSQTTEIIQFFQSSK
ncbi:MAG: alpha/beta hydrolase family protein [Bacteroidota bacterium]|jgi:pimeloyl-ACP methyl ester carboxylesterase